jgi:hypothetical protein
VDCGLGLVMLSFWPTMRFSSVDFPTFGFPTTVTIPALGILEASPLRQKKEPLKNLSGSNQSPA